MIRALCFTLLLLAGSWITADAGQCRLPDAPGVTCCCRTARGGLCCGEMTFCGGYVPGCLCQ